MKTKRQREMRNSIVVVCIFMMMASSCSNQRKAVFEYDDVKNGLRLKVPNSSWIINIPSVECGEDRRCWSLKNTASGANIYMLRSSRLALLTSGQNVYESLKIIRGRLVANQDAAPAYKVADVSNVSEISSKSETEAGSFFRVSWTVRYHDGVESLLAAYFCLHSDPSRTFLFIGESLIKYAEVTERDFVTFLHNIGPATKNK